MTREEFSKLINELKQKVRDEGPVQMYMPPMNLENMKLFDEALKADPLFKNIKIDKDDKPV